MSASPGVRCLDDELFDYAAGRLSAPRVAVWQRHLAVCDLCSAGLDRERRLRVALAGAPSMPGDLRSALVAMGRSLEQPGTVNRARLAEPLALLAPGAPPCHRSPLRATVVAAAAVGVSAAAAWSLTVMGSPAERGAVPVPARDAAASPGPTATPATGAAAIAARWMPAGTVRVTPGQRAESIP
jgi:hypothetical protein